MKKNWTTGLDTDQSKELRGDYKSSHLVRKRLRELLQQKIETSVKASRKEDAYENPNWAYKQADARGYERALAEIIALISD